MNSVTATPVNETPNPAPRPLSQLLTETSEDGAAAVAAYSMLVDLRQDETLVVPKRNGQSLIISPVGLQSQEQQEQQRQQVGPSTDSVIVDLDRETGKQGSKIK